MTPSDLGSSPCPSLKRISCSHASADLSIHYVTNTTTRTDLRVLVVDDSAVNRKMVCRLMASSVLDIHQAQNTIKTDAKRISAIQRATQKTTKVRLGTLSNRALCKDRAKTSSLGSLGLVLERSGALLGWLLAVLGRLLGLLGRFLGGMWPLLGHSWASLGWSGSLPVCILAPLDAPGRDFFGFGALLGWVLEGFGGMFWHALCCPSRFIT